MNGLASVNRKEPVTERPRQRIPFPLTADATPLHYQEPELARRRPDGLRHYTVHYDYHGCVFGWGPVYARNMKEARAKHRAKHPEDKIVRVHRGPVVFKLIFR